MSIPPSDSNADKPPDNSSGPTPDFPHGEDATEFTPASSEEATEFTPPSPDDVTDFKPPSALNPQKPGAPPVFQFSPGTPASSAQSALRISRRRFSSGELVAHGVYRIVQEIESSGREAFAYRGEAVVDRRPVFIKQLVEARSTAQDRQKLAELRDRLVSIDNEFCLRCFDLFMGEQVLQIFEYLPEAMDLREAMRHNPTQIRAQADRIIWQLVQGVAYLQSKEIVHRDLKPSNIMVQYQAPDGFVIKIVDYGTISLVGEDGEHTTFAGSRHYAPPEALRRKFQSRTKDLKKYDWWSVGRIIQEMITGSTIAEIIGKGISSKDGQRFTGTDVHFEEIMLEERMDYYQCRAGMMELTEPLLDESEARYRPLLRGLLTTDIEQRWGYEQIVLWFQNQSPPESYDVRIDARSALVFNFQGKGYRLGEIAQTLATHQYWPTAQKFLFQGLNATRGEKTLIDFIRLDIGDKLLVRDIDDITSLPNPRKLPNRELLPALEDYATGLALVRIAKSDEHPLGLHIRGLPVDMNTLSRWSVSKVPEEVNRVAILIYPPLIEFLRDITPDFYQEILPLLRDFDEVRRLETAAAKVELDEKRSLTPAETANILALLLLPPTKLAQFVAQVREKFRLSTLPALNPLLDPVPPNDPSRALVVFLLHSSASQAKRFITHDSYFGRERSLINQDANSLIYQYVWLSTASILRHRTILLSNLILLIPGHASVFFVYCVGLGVLFRANPDVLAAPIVYLVIFYMGCLLSIRSQIWTSIKGYVKGNTDGWTIQSNSGSREALQQVPEISRGVRLTRQQVRQRYKDLQKRVASLPPLKNIPVKPLPNLPEAHGVTALFGLLAIVMLYCAAVPFAMFFSVDLIRDLMPDQMDSDQPTILLEILTAIPLGFMLASWILAVILGVYSYKPYQPVKI